MIQTINPATEELVAEYPVHSDADLHAALEGAVHAQRSWRNRSVEGRAEVLMAVARLLREQRDDLARLITTEMGKPIVEAEGEIEKCAGCCEYYATAGPAHIADEPVAVAAPETGLVAFEPLGVVLAVMPWNFPFWQVLRFAAPALLAGNGAILKHASNVSGCALAIERILNQAGAPDGLFRTVLIPGDRVKDLIADPRIAAVTLTGSTDVGRLVAAAAGSQVKKQVLELGGSDPFVVLADADLDRVAHAAARARNQNAGQSCIAAKRFIVAAEVAEEFAERMAAAVAAMTMGDPLDRATKLGPLARRDLQESLQLQVERSVESGARVLAGGAVPDGLGYYFQGTVVSAITPDMPLFLEETFGPVAAVIPGADEDALVQLANQTEFGLGASVWTSDRDHGVAVARRIEAGSVFVNGQVASDPRFPFGGVKASGYGRELGAFGIREFTNIKTLRSWPEPPPV